MTTSYKLAAIAEKRAQKKLDREAEEQALSAARKAAGEKQAASEARIAAKMERIASGVVA